MDIKETTVIDKINYEQECLGYINIKLPQLSEQYAYILNVDGKFKNKFIKLYRLKTGETEVLKVKADAFNASPLSEQMIIKTIAAGEEKKWKRDQDGKWIRIDETEMILYQWSEVEC